ncbi:MAG: undecaprenyldiphospho-muramoylpentapeptide beta-N-acetylglucosaminyltransferase [Actinobacteria bacterium]|nr:undecaprenyldiphospho-muramoylpentapeptide beta-N-acetylglucosaminyltransferase [Actinomycetota bacterium]
MNVVIAGGGTAGHVNPAIALARALSKREQGTNEVAFIGTAEGVEASLVPEAGFPLETVQVHGFDRARPGSLPATGVRAARAIAQARRALSRLGADVVVGMGGYVSLPACVAGRALGLPVVLHEQNIVFGLANRVCRPIARRTAVSFEATLASAGAKGVLTGNPVMPELGDFDRAAERAKGVARFELDPARRTVLIFGGSQGAHTVNQAAIALGSVWADRDDLQVVHVAGRAAYPRLVAEAARRHEEHEGQLVYRVVEYVDRMVEAYAAADVALCRGGASTVAELTCAGLPSIIVPYPHHRDRQQERHAGVLASAGAALVVADAECTTRLVAEALDRLLADERGLAVMSEAAASLGRPDAAFRLADVVRAAPAGR